MNRARALLHLSLCLVAWVTGVWLHRLYDSARDLKASLPRGLFLPGNGGYRHFEMGRDCSCVDVTLMCILPSWQRLQGAQVRKWGPEPTEAVLWTWHSGRRNPRTADAPAWRALRIRMVGARAASLKIFRQRMAEYSQLGNGSRLLTHRYGIDGHFVELTAPTGGLIPQEGTLCLPNPIFWAWRSG